EQAAHVEVGRADVHRIVDHVELGVELGRLIFEQRHALAQQPGVGEARRGDGGVVVGLGGGDDPHRGLAPPGPVEPPQHRRRWREIGRDHVDLGRVAHVGTHRARPGR
nr:hypothetical protein [Tanacetum cinerariifolium]